MHDHDYVKLCHENYVNCLTAPGIPVIGFISDISMLVIKKFVCT